MQAEALPGMPQYRYRGARAMVLLHERELGRFLSVWRQAVAAGISLPTTSDRDYASLEALLCHVLGAARGYMTWMCEVLDLPEPKIDLPPALADVSRVAEAYVAHVCARWRTPLAGVDEERFGRPEFASRWGVRYCVDAMLEHAVMHPIRHEFQLRELLSEKGA